MNGWRRCFGRPGRSQAASPTLKEMGFGRRTVVVTAILMAIGVGGLLWGLEERGKTVSPRPPPTMAPYPSRPNPHNRTKRQTDDKPSNPPPPRCGAKLVLNYPRGSTTSFTFDLCQVLNCGGLNITYKRWDVYLCDGEQLEVCETTTRTTPIHSPCDSWRKVGWTTGEWDPPARQERTYINSPTYIDWMGVPRGVPNEYKLADQIASGFENIPIFSALFPVTPNKNVDRINFVHYNVLRLSNATRDAMEGLAEQMAPTSLMALQNRMALDMLLAEKGGVCSMFGEMCCTVIPNNTAPDGKVTRALNQLRALSKEMHDASGVSNPLEGWMITMFGKWKNLITACLTSIAVFLAILVTCGCCCVPCLRTMISRLITTALTKEKAPPPYSAGMLSLLTMPEDGEDAEALQLV